MGKGIIVTSYKFSPYKCPYFKFYWTYKLNFLVQTFNNIKYIYWLKCKWPWQTLMVKGEGQRSHKINKWSYLLCIYLLLFVCPYILIEQDFFVYVFIVIFTCFCQIFIVLQSIWLNQKLFGKTSNKQNEKENHVTIQWRNSTSLLCHYQRPSATHLRRKCILPNVPNNMFVFSPKYLRINRHITVKNNTNV